MKAFPSKVIIVLAVCLILATSSAFAQQRSEPLTNASVIKLVRAGFKEKTVIAIIHSRANRFDLSADRLIELKHNGVTENVILAMLAQGGAEFSSDDDWGDDAFFKGSHSSSAGTTMMSSQKIRPLQSSAPAVLRKANHADVE